MQDIVQRKEMKHLRLAHPEPTSLNPYKGPALLGRTLCGRSGSGCHDGAAFSTPLTDIDAALHLRVVTQGLAVGRALAANLGTGAADNLMRAGAAQHCIGAGRANSGAGGHQADVFWCRVGTSFGQTVVDGLQADRMALDTVVNAIIHGLRPINSRMISHVTLLLPSGQRIGVPASPSPIARCLFHSRRGSEPEDLNRFHLYNSVVSARGHRQANSFAVQGVIRRFHRDGGARPPGWRIALGLVVIGRCARRMCLRRLAAIAVVVIHAGLRFG